MARGFQCYTLARGVRPHRRTASQPCSIDYVRPGFLSSSQCSAAATMARAATAVPVTRASAEATRPSSEPAARVGAWQRWAARRVEALHQASLAAAAPQRAPEARSARELPASPECPAQAPLASTLRAGRIRPQAAEEQAEARMDAALL